MALLRFAFVCQSNVNRSVAAHKLALEQKDFAFENVESYGVGSSVKLPGEAADSPNRYNFDEVAYAEILDDLLSKNEAYYQKLGVIDMLRRDTEVKQGPMRWQDRNRTIDLFDVVVTFERRVYDVVLQDLSRADARYPCVVINIEVKDTAQEAVASAPDAVFLCQSIANAGDDWEDAVEEVLQSFAANRGREVPDYDICYQ
jgi:RNA polymerase II subunit A C-terminal domain phosphatase SSU72